MIHTIYTPSAGGAWYPRLYELSTGDLLCGFDTNEDGGDTVIKVIRSGDGGITWSQPVKAGSFPGHNCANASFLEQPDGSLLLAFRSNKEIKCGLYSSIRVNISHDQGITWEPHSLITEETGTGGVYEPHLGYLNDQVVVYYANDSLNVVDTEEQQNIELKYLSEHQSWSEKIIISDGRLTNSRDGMPVWCQLQDKSYGLVIESTSMREEHPFMIQLLRSLDGIHYNSAPQNIYIPAGYGKKAGAPYLIALPDGKCAVSFQTDEDATETGDHASTMKLIISNDSSLSEFDQCIIPFPTRDGYYSNWNSMLYVQNYILAATSTNDPVPCIQLNTIKYP